MAGPWGRLAAALGPPGDRDPPALRALRRPRPAPRHQTEVLLLLLESPRELCGGGHDSAGGSPEWGGSVGGVGGALLTLLTLPPAPPPAPPRSLLLLATLTFLLATGDVGGVAVFGALLVEGEVTGGAPAAAAECLRELRRARTPGAPPGRLGPLRSRSRETPGIQPLALLLVEEGEDPADPCDGSGGDPGGSRGPATPHPAPPSAFLLTPAAHAQLLRHQTGGGALGGAPPYATGDPAPLHATLLKGGGGFGGLPPPRLATLAQHPAFPPPLRLFYLLCLLEGGALKKRGALPPPLPPRFTAALFPGGGDPPEIFLPRFEAAAAFCSQNGGVRTKGGGQGWLRGLVVSLGGGPPVLFCRAVVTYSRWFGGDIGDKLGGAAEKLLAGGHPAAPPHLLELAKVLGGPLGGALRAKVFNTPPPPPGTPQLRGVLKVLTTPPAPPRGDPQIRGYLRRVMAAERGGWGGGQGVLSAAAPLLPSWGSPLLPSPPLGPPLFFGVGGDPDVGDRARLHAALAAALGPPKLAAVLGTPTRYDPPPPPQAGGGGDGGGAPTLLPAPAPPCCLRCLPGPPPPFPAPPGAPQDPEGWGRAVAARGGPVAVRLRLRVELLGGALNGDPPQGEAPPRSRDPPHGGGPPRSGVGPAPGAGPPPSMGAPPHADGPPPSIGAPPPAAGLPPSGASPAPPPPTAAPLPHDSPAPPSAGPLPSGAAPPPPTADPPHVAGPPSSAAAPPPPPAAPPPRILALQLRVGGCAPQDPPPAEGRLAGLGGGGAELGLTLRPHRPLPPTLHVAAIFTPGGGSRGGGGVLLAPLPPLPLPLGVQLRPLALPPPWDPPRRRRAFRAMWGALGGHPESRLVLKGGVSPPPALTPFLLDGGGGGAGGWVAAAALPPRGVALVRGGPGGGWVELRCQRWGGLVALARLLRGQGEA